MFGNQPIIPTRTTPPRRRSDLLERNHLMQSLSEMIEKRLTLVSAPAGYGKTSLLVEFANKSSLPVCWYSIDRFDIDPVRFISYFAAAIQRKFPAFGIKTSAALIGNQPKIDIDYVATVMINDILENISEHFLIILDDYHLVNDNLEIQAFMSRLLVDLDENCHFLLASRTLLSIPVMSTLVMQSEVDGLSYEELQFLTEEIQQYYQKNYHLALSWDESQKIYESSEGWITGIILTSQVNEEEISIRSRLSRVAGFSMDDYFSQIVEHLPEDLRLFLLQSSLLEEFDTKLCQVVIGTTLGNEKNTWDKWINEVQMRNLFTMPVGEEGDWIRYHPLFLEFLQFKMSIEFPVETRSILINLAKYSIAQDDWDRAFSIYRRLNSQEDLVQLIENNGLELILKGRITTLSAWLDSLPTEILNSRPFIISLQGNIAMVLGNTNLAISLFNQAIDELIGSENRMQYLQTLSMRSAGFRVIGKLEESKKDAVEILRLAGDSNDDLKMKGGAQRIIGLCYFHQGFLQNALDDLEKALQIMRSVNDQKTIAVIQLEIGLIYENLGNYSQAKKFYSYSLEYWKSHNNLFWLANIYNNLGVLYQLTGEYLEAYDAFIDGLKFARASGYARMEAFILTGIGDVFTDLQIDDQAMQAFYMAEVIADRTQEHFLQVYLKIQRALLSGYHNEFNTGFDLLQQALEQIGPNGSAMERNLVNLEFAGLQILQKKGHLNLSTLEKTSSFFESGGHKVQFEKAHLYLAIAYILNHQFEKVIVHLLHIFSCLEGEYFPAALIASAARHKSLLKTYKPDLMTNEFQQFFNIIEEFQERLPFLRRAIKEKTQVVSFSAPTIQIRSFGRMQVKVNQQVISSSTWQTQAARDLFFMLLAHPEGMTKEEISLVFWPDASIHDAKFRFKNTIYRLRRAVGKDAVILDQNVYRFNNNLNYEYDVEIFLKENARASQAQEPLEKLSNYREAIKQYKGAFLAEIDSTWVISPREYLRQMYLNILLQVSTIYLNQSNYDMALDYCQRAMNEDNLLEDAYRLAMKIYAAMGNRSAIVHQYQRCVEILEKEINAPPSAQTIELYEFLIK